MAEQIDREREVKENVSYRAQNLDRGDLLRATLSTLTAVWDSSVDSPFTELRGSTPGKVFAKYYVNKIAQISGGGTGTNKLPPAIRL